MLQLDDSADGQSVSCKTNFSGIRLPVVVKSFKMISIPTETDDRFDLGREQRTQRLIWVFYGVLAMVFVLGNFFLQERVESGVLQACGLTILCYGTVLYVHEIEHIREVWLWKGVVTTVPLHVGFVYFLFWWDARFPGLAHSGFVLTYALWIVLVVEMLFVLPIFEHFRTSSVSRDAQQNEGPPGSRRPLSQTWRAAADRLRGRLRQKTAGQDREASPGITIAGEQDLDLEKEERETYLEWSLGGVAALLLVIYKLRGISLGEVWLYVLKVSLFTAFCYGHLLYVQEKEYIRESWVWKTVLATIPFHIAFVGIIVGIDRTAPYLASNAIVFLFVLWAIGWVETKLMDQIADDYQP